LLQQPRLAFQWPTLRRLSGVHQIRTSEDETLVVALHRAVQPVSGWRGTDKNEQRNRRNLLRFSAGGAQNRDLFQSIRSETSVTWLFNST